MKYCPNISYFVKWSSFFLSVMSLEFFHLNCHVSLLWKTTLVKIDYAVDYTSDAEERAWKRISPQWMWDQLNPTTLKSSIEGYCWNTLRHIQQNYVTKTNILEDSYHINIFVFLTPLQIFVPRLEMIFFINHYFLVCIFKYCKISRVNSGLEI